MPILKLVHYPRTSTKLRHIFNLSFGSLELPGQIYERIDPTYQDKYFWNFCGKFPWEVGDTLPPFRYLVEGRDLSSTLFFGVPQAVIKLVFDYEPSKVDKYLIDTNRNCGNCEYLRYNKDLADSFYERSTSERFEEPPRSLYTCGITGEQVDHLTFGENTRKYAKVLRESLKHNSCKAHTRKAYKIEASLYSRQNGEPSERWVPSEHRRLLALNPQAISFNSTATRIYLPGGIEIQVVDASAGLKI